AIAASIITFLVQKADGAVASFEHHSLSLRLANAVVSYPRYILKTVWPANLSIIYPLPQAWPIVMVVVSLLFLALVSWLALKRLWTSQTSISSNHQQSTQELSTSFLFTGWFWFVGMLVPTIGLVQVGRQAMADRYMYLSSIGLFIVLVW